MLEELEVYETCKKHSALFYCGQLNIVAIPDIPVGSVDTNKLKLGEMYVNGTTTACTGAPEA